jgi:hypothetical protein
MPPLQCGTKIKLPDNRKPQLASAEAEWWNKRWGRAS